MILGLGLKRREEEEEEDGLRGERKIVAEENRRRRRFVNWGILFPKNPQLDDDGVLTFNVQSHFCIRTALCPPKTLPRFINFSEQIVFAANRSGRIEVWFFKKILHKQ